MKRKYLIFLLLFIGVLIPSILPLFNQGFFQMHDYTHLARLTELDRALKDGHFPPRLSKNLGWGYGMPLFHFYAPLPYLLGEVWHLLGFNYLNSIKIVFGLTALIGFVGMYLLAKKFWGKQGAMLASLALIYAPYRAVDFYVRGALGELLAISMIPWVLWSIIHLIDDNKKINRNTSILALVMAAFLLSHTVLNLITLPLFIIFSIFYSLINKDALKQGFKVAKGFLLGFFLAGFFIFPAFLEKKFTAVDKLTTGFSHYSHHFLYFRQFISGNWGFGGSVDGINDGMSFHLGKVHLLLVIVTISLSLLMFKMKKKIDKRMWVAGFFALIIGLLAWLSTYHAKPVWDFMPLMAYIQFPWRLNSVIIVLVAFLAGGGVFYLNKIVKKKAGLIYLLIFSFLILVKNYGYFRPKEYLKTTNDFYYTEENEIKESMSGVIPDFIPRWVKNKPEEIAYDEYKIIEGEPQIEIISDRTQKLILKINSKEEFKLQLNRFYFPGWKLFIDKNEVDFEYENNNGVILTKLPAGSYLLKLVYKDTLIRVVSNFISLISLVVIIKLLIKSSTD